MPKHLLVVVSDAAEGSEERFNDFLTNEHLPDVLTVKGFVSARRFRLAAHQPEIAMGLPAQRYMHFYEVETDDLDATFADLAQARERPGWRTSGGCIADGQTVAVYDVITDVHTSP